VTAQILDGKATAAAVKADLKERVAALNEFLFVHNNEGRTIRRCVYNFLIVPQRGIKRQMDDVRSAAADYRQRFFGAAQVQVIMDGDLPQAEREAIFSDLMKPITPVITAINTTGGHS